MAYSGNREISQLAGAFAFARNAPFSRATASDNHCTRYRGTDRPWPQPRAPSQRFATHGSVVEPKPWTITVTYVPTFELSERKLVILNYSCSCFGRVRWRWTKEKWSKQWLLERRQYSDMDLLLELQSNEPADFNNYLRMENRYYFMSC